MKQLFTLPVKYSLNLTPHLSELFVVNDPRVCASSSDDHAWPEKLGMFKQLVVVNLTSLVLCEGRKIKGFISLGSTLTVHNRNVYLTKYKRF